MGLNDFSTDGPRTYSDDSTRQKSLTDDYVSEFEDEWGQPLHEAERDHDFIKERLDEGYDVGDLCQLFQCLEHTIISRFVEMVDEDVVDVEDIPDVTHPAYNDKSIAEYVKRRVHNKTLSTSTSSSSSESNSDSSGGLSGLDSFKS